MREPALPKEGAGSVLSLSGDEHGGRWVMPSLSCPLPVALST